MLGDNSLQSEDSRLTRAVPGYQHGAIPRSHLRAVVRLLYFPIDRMRTFR